MKVKLSLPIFWAIILAVFSTACKPKEAKQSDKEALANSQIRGWNILTDNEEEAMAILDGVEGYDINHLQISHHTIMDLKDAREEKKRELANKITAKAKQLGISEVVVWDHALYSLDYYPAKFRTGPDSTINLDNPEFWEWMKEDYREMLSLLPEIDGIVLTFIETGARTELQYSEKWKTPAEKLAAVINTVAEVVIEEKGLKLYARTFAYNDEEYHNLTTCFEHVTNQEIVLMMKETPHDFFILHPNNSLIGKINRPTIVEFDLGNEYNGQGIIANTFPEVPHARWNDFRTRENVIGYVARVDRYGTTRSIDRPSEILPFALDKMEKEPDVQIDAIYDAFITQRYGKDALPHIKEAFKLSKEIILSSFYTLGLNTTSHSRLNFHYRSIYSRHVSGRWLENKILKVDHGVNKEFHWFKDIVNHLSPAVHKDPNQRSNRLEMAEVFANGWLQQEERMNEEYLQYVITEKQYAISQAQKALSHIEASKPHVSDSDYEDLYETFYRTLLTTQLYESIAKAYYGYRIYAKGEAFRTDAVKRVLDEGLKGILTYAPIIRNYPKEVPSGQWNWKKDGEAALEYVEKITKGWEEYGGIAYEIKANTR